jgi:hypothetical protein
MLTPTFWQHETGLVAVRKDLGLSTSLRAPWGVRPRTASRSEMVQATAVIGASLPIAVSAPRGRNHARGHCTRSRLLVFIPPRPVCEQATVHVT